MPIPGVESELPIVGFEIESSWRSRKHIKGDVVNLRDLRPLVGVIVLLGDAEKIVGVAGDERQVVANAVAAMRRSTTAGLVPCVRCGIAV